MKGGSEMKDFLRRLEEILAAVAFAEAAEPEKARRFITPLVPECDP